MTKRDDIPFFATVPVQLEELLTSELSALGAHEPRPTRAGVAWHGDAETAQRVLLWSRLASRLLATIGEGPAPNADALFESLRALPWERHLPTGIPFAVDFVGHNAVLRDSRYSARLSKDAIRARFTDLGLPPPEARPAEPEIRCNIRLAAQRATASVDLSGTSLHRRGYRSSARDAPLKENLAAALLLRAGWPAIAAEGGTFLDPFCGSGTLAIEAALMAADIAPGLIRREGPALSHWLGFDAEAQERLLTQARQRARTGRDSAPRLLASDSDPAAVAIARANAARAGVSELIDFRVQAWEGRDRPPPQPPGLMVTNPPWGWRLETNRPIEGLYMDIGDRARRILPGWRVAVFTGDARLLSALGLRAERIYRLHNGRLPARLGIYAIAADARPREEAPPAAPPQALVNRLHKNLRHRRRWARREDLGAYRVYDADLPEYAFAIDLYEDNEDSDRRYVHIAEYAPPEEINPRRAARRREQALAAVREVFEVPAEAVILKTRRRRRGTSQYGRQGAEPISLVVREGAAQLRVELGERLDTGIFLDHRPLRRRIAAEAGGRRFLNLFCYTGTATVHAALAGARTTSIDLSRPYLRWLADNLQLNGIDPAGHRIIRADCRQWLIETRQKGRQYDIVLLDPPSVSRSRDGAGELDIQRDHPALIDAAYRLLAPGGVLYFSTNRRRFQFHPERLEVPGGRIREITGQTVPADYRRQVPPHRCWRISAPAAAERE
ncbi:bifunctional 23S rRNA (guanine(2069)-N(7))-methyltransferase RlmK/23S rRNA (guanine(2445)-N(2))-methyltransferase RlmL [Arhodomonas sp. SL1]|uniref:bifunctional 23S rRNA (guanine(2069)-N(7))-methyltransferase RlmK/23S rRNA (guanine(2445)-N(2))-methyltransferase RlmL n=1 Tax=Arhodomonas sp. SL1 TaxID=3425691 RepID=UPI003F881B7D